MIARIAAYLQTAALAMALAVCVGHAAAQMPAGENLAVRAGKILPVSPDHPWVIEDGVIIIRDGRIVSIGPAEDIEIPDDLRLVELPDATIMPGMVAASTALASRHAGEVSIGAGFHATDTFDPYASFAGTLAGGVTTAHLNPGWHRLLSGQGAVAKLGGRAEGRLLRADSDLTINLGGEALSPPDIMEFLVPATSEEAIQPQRVQRPTTRLAQFLALKEAIEEALQDDHDDFDHHRDSLREAWGSGRTLRIQAQRSADLTGAINFARTYEREAYLVGGIEAARVAEHIREAGLPLVYTITSDLSNSASNLGPNPGVLEPNLDDLAQLHGIRLALTTAEGQPTSELRLAAALAQRAGLTEQQILEAVTRVPAEILGVSDRVGSLEPGKDADFIVLSGHPLATSSHVHRVYVNGRLAYSSASNNETIVVRGGTVWLGPDNWMENGSLLIENGRIAAVGKYVPHPPQARVVEIDPGSFITPGFIDAQSRLGFEGDSSAPNPELSLARLIGAPDVTEHRVARAGVTTVIMTPYSFNNGGSQVAAVKTHGVARADRVIRDTAGVILSVAGSDPTTIAGRLRGRMQQAQQYLDTWTKYYQDLAEWEKRRADGETPQTPAEERTEDVVVPQEADPITGTWSGTISGGPLPEPVSGELRLRLTGNAIEGQFSGGMGMEQARFVGTLNGRRVTGRIEVDTGGMGTPQVQAEIVEEDRMRGTIALGPISLDFEMTRVEKGAVEFRVVTRRAAARGADGRPQPPTVNESLEPLRAVLEKKIPLIVDARSAAEIKATADALESYGIHVVLMNAHDARLHADLLRERSIGVVLPRNMIRTVGGNPYHQAADLARLGLLMAFQGAAEDGGRSLPLFALHAVERGLSAEDALAALTINPAKMFQLDDHIGSLDVGKHADFVIFSGHPFEAGSAVRRVFIGGREVLP